MAQIWAFLERITPRAVAALLVFAVAAVAPPSEVGIYSATALVYTLLQALTDAPMRQLLPRWVTSSSRMLGRYRLTVAVTGPVVMLATVMVLLASTHRESGTTALAMLPAVAAPVPGALAAGSLGRLQVADRWRTLATGQFLAATVASLISVPLVIVTGQIVFLAAHMVLTETIFALWCVRKARSLGVGEIHTPADAHGSETREIGSLVAFSALAWGQGQSDRAILTVVAGVARLAEFSLGSALARAVADPLGASSANILRARLAAVDTTDTDQIRRTAERVLGRATVLAAGAFALAIAASAVADQFLDESWSSALRAVPIFALAAFPVALNWSVPVLLVASGAASRAPWAPVVGLALAPAVAWASMSSLALGAALVVVREITVTTVGMTIARRVAPWRTFSWSLAATVGAAALVATAATLT